MTQTQSWQVEYPTTAGEVGVVDTQYPRTVTLDVRSFGVKGDGTTDNATGLIALRDYMNEDRTLTYTVVFPRGTYLYTNNRWLYGTGKVIIRGEGAVLQCTATSPFNADRNPLSMGAVFAADGGNVGGAGSVYEIGDLIDTASRGDTSVTTTTAADAGGYSVGDRVYIGSYDQQFGGYPPNHRYFQYCVVMSADAGTGVITLNRPLDFDYSTDLLDFDVPNLAFGKARILKLNRALDQTDLYFPEMIHMYGVKFLENPNGSLHRLIIQAEDVYLENVTSPGGVVPTSNRVFEAVGCDFYHDGDAAETEPDKLVETCIFRKCKINRLTASTGIHNMILEDNDFYELFSVSPKSLTVRKNRFHDTINGTQMVQLSGLSPVHRCTFKENTLYPPAAADYIGNFSGNPLSFTVGSVGASNEIKVANDATGRSLVKVLDSGMQVYCLTTANFGTISSVTYDGVDWVIAGDWHTAPIAAETWYYTPCISVDIDYSNEVHGKNTLVPYRYGAPRLNSKKVSAHEFNSDQIRVLESGIETFVAPGFIRSITFNLQKAYTGAGAPTLVIGHQNTVGGYNAIATLDLTGAEGIRYVDGGTTFGATAGETLTSANCGLFGGMFRFVSNGGAGISGTQLEMPKFTLTIEVENI